MTLCFLDRCFTRTITSLRTEINVSGQVVAVVIKETLSSRFYVANYTNESLRRHSSDVTRRRSHIKGLLIASHAKHYSLYVDYQFKIVKQISMSEFKISSC